jgi:List-Bact-rpt repeat protein
MHRFRHKTGPSRHPRGSLLAALPLCLAALFVLPASASAATQTLSVEKNGAGTGTVVSSPAGINCGATCSAAFEGGKTITLAGSPGPNSGPVKWSGCDSLNGENKCLVTMSAARTVTATFDPIQRGLKVSKAGAGTGTVTSSPAGIECGATCSATFANGTLVVLSAASGPNTLPAQWSGCAKVTEGKCEVTMSAAKAVTATFELGIQLTVAKLGTGTGTVTSSPSGIECGQSCSASFPKGSKATLTATPGLHSQPVKWAGCDEVKEGACIVTMSAAREVTATFDIEPQYVPYTVSIGLKGTGKGTVTSFPAGIECPTDCSSEFTFKTVLKLTATPTPGSELDHWSLSSCGSAPVCSISVKSDRSVNAVFNAVGTRTLTVAKAGSGQGVVTSTNVAAIECGQSCSAELDVKAKVVLSAAAQVGSTFTGWSGEGCKGTKNCRVTMNEARNVTATFSANPSPPPVRCHVPRLKGKTLKRARAALFRANCSLGKVKKPRGKGTLVVGSSRPGAGAVRPAGARVSLRLVRRHR